MSMMFVVPCPNCGMRMTTENNGDRRCPSCQDTYRAQMGHLVPVADLRGDHTAAPEGTSVAAAGKQ